MPEPVPYGWYHLLWIGISVLCLVFLFVFRKKYNEKWLKSVLGIYGIGALILEVLKQIVWSFNYDPVSMISTWDFQWYAFPFQLCTTPIFVCVICLFLKNNIVRKSLLSYMAFITIWGSLMTMIIPDSCFVETTLVNIHTMYLHCGSFVVSMYLLLTKEVELKFKNVIRALVTFIFFVFIALMLDIWFYKLGIIGDETFNMFYISPYFDCELPVFVTVQSKVQYLVFLGFYVFAISMGGIAVYGLGKLLSIKKRRYKLKK
jgi:hypothetical protein